ncbi:hypothetical protein JHK87_022653 [Glycine soja]|nr:hypothetical protein JHK87_022653 [Glycine soja]
MAKVVEGHRRYGSARYKSETLHAREEIVSELLQHLRGNAARVLLEGVMKSTRQMFAEQEAVQSRLFIIQDVMQNSVQAWAPKSDYSTSDLEAPYGFKCNGSPRSCQKLACPISIKASLPM